ncbi:hypothetical protein [Mycolicibacterium nivoides]|uniref:Uncharacterized protein n=1 Tax=Mycolicibacterium nivoides TaxID=2487344 RepID=A0ABW9LFS7_9MYCO
MSESEFNPGGRPTVKLQIKCAVGRPWAMQLEWLGSYFKDLDPDEILTVEYAVFEELPEIPVIEVIRADCIEVSISTPLGYFRVLDSKGNELPL